MRVRLTNDTDGSIFLESPYDAVFVQQLKAAIDYGGRSWDPDRKRWRITALYSDTLMEFLRGWPVDIRDDRDPGTALEAPPPMPEDLRLAFDALFLAYAAPLCVAEASYRALAKYWHPDRGGKPEDFHRVNDAIDIVRKYLDPQPEARYDDTEDSDIPF